jgi:uncharacterized protein DUF3455
MINGPTKLFSSLLRAGALVSACAAFGCASAPIVTPAYAPPAPLAPPVVPDAIAVPAGAQVVAHLHARDSQVYACGAGSAGGPAAFAWTLKRPDAALTGDDGRAVGTHGAGPTWTSTDGSAVVGKKIAQADAPVATAVPWLLLGAVSTTGAGIFADVTYVQRVATSGGKAPPSGCAADNVGAETAAPYTADYYFYRGGKP